MKPSQLLSPFVLPVLILLVYFLHKAESRQDQKKLLRKKRYVAFPEGAAFSAVYCVTSQMGITDGATIFTEGINWGFVYDLPNDTRPFLDVNKAVNKRRNRRDLYIKVEDIMTSMGYNGKSCILRSLCEAGRKFSIKENSLVYHILSLIFRFPQEPILAQEPDDHRMYHWASKIGTDEAVFCLTSLMGITSGSDLFSLNINWGLVYELPNETKPLLDINKPAMKRRNRRDLYKRVEKILTSMGYDGRSCILRSLCEAGNKFNIKENSLVYHILSLIFRFPQEAILPHESDDHRIYHWASLIGNKDIPKNIDKDKCSDMFHCPFSLIDLALGYYSQNDLILDGRQ